MCVILNSNYLYHAIFGIVYCIEFGGCLLDSRSPREKEKTEKERERDKDKLSLSRQFD